MKAVGYRESQAIDHPDALVDIDIPTPTPGARDLLVRVNAISVNPVDTKIRVRVSPQANEPKTLGWDAVGEVVQVGSDVAHYAVGDTVWYAGDITRPGTNAEYHLVDERIAGRQPKSLSNAEAAAIPLTAITAWELLFDRLQVPRNRTDAKSDQTRILIVGAAGGVGSILTQLAAQLTDATVIGTASRPNTTAWIKELGADHVVDHSKPLAEELRKNGIEYVTHVISLTHTDQHFDQLVEALAPQGKLGLIDDPADPLDVMKLKPKALSLHWEMMFTRSRYQTEDMDQQRQLLNELADLIDSGTIQTTLGEHYGLINADNLKRAHAHIESGKAIGKIVLEGF